VYIVEPVDGGRYPVYMPQVDANAVTPEGSLPFGTISVNFSVSGGASTVRWSFDERGEGGSAICHGWISIQFDRSLVYGQHTFTVETDTARETITFHMV